MNSSYVKFSRQTGISAVATLSFYARNLLLLPVLTRFLGAADYGIWVQVIALIELLVTIASLQVDSSILRFLPGRKKSGLLADDMASSLLLTGLVGGLFALASLDLDFGDCLFHYSFYLVATMLLRWVAGMEWVWDVTS